MLEWLRHAMNTLPMKPAQWPNLVTLPRSLRDAIPTEPTMVGRVLHLSTIDAGPTHTHRGPRVQLRLLVEESGKLTGQFPLLVDLDVAAAKQLAASLTGMAARAESLEPGPGW